MTKRRLLLTLISFALSANFLFSQELTFPANNEVYIGDTKVNMEKKVIIIEYRILLGKNVQSCKVKAIYEIRKNDSKQQKDVPMMIESDRLVTKYIQKTKLIHHYENT